MNPRGCCRRPRRYLSGRTSLTKPYVLLQEAYRHPSRWYRQTLPPPLLTDQRASEQRS